MAIITTRLTFCRKSVMTSKLTPQDSNKPYSLNALIPVVTNFNHASPETTPYLTLSSTHAGRLKRIWWAKSSQCLAAESLQLLSRPSQPMVVRELPCENKGLIMVQNRLRLSNKLKSEQVGPNLSQMAFVSSGPTTRRCLSTKPVTTVVQPNTSLI